MLERSILDKNNLDALCKRYEVDNSSRTLHGALLDSEILADVYLMMTGGQVKMNIDQDVTDLDDQHLESSMSKDTKKERQPTKIVYATEEEMIAHKNIFRKLMILQVYVFGMNHLSECATLINLISPQKATLTTIK